MIIIHNKIKNKLFTGEFINCLLYSMTIPLVNIFFIQKVSTVIYSVVNWVSIIVVLLMNRFLKNQNNRDKLEKIFLQIIIIDTILLLTISLFGAVYINFRFFSMAILNGTSTAIWACIIKSNINRVFTKNDLTDFQTQQDYLMSIAQLIGASLAIILTKFNLNIDILMLIQVIASAIMGYFDYSTVKIIKKKLIK